MTTVFSISGSLFSRTISLNEIEEIKNAKNPSEIKKLWDKIADWFCGTDKENAKKALFVLLNNDDIDIKIDAFYQLKAMASPAFQEAFTYTTAINDTEFTVNLSIGALFSTDEIAMESEKINLSDHIKTFTNKCFSDDDYNIDFYQTKLDVPRSEVYFYNANNNKTQFKIEDLPSLESKISKEQKIPLNVALSQIGMNDIRAQINQLSKEMPLAGNLSHKIYFSLDEKGNISVEIHLFQNLDPSLHSVYQEYFPDLKYPCLHAKTQVNIASNGNCDIVEITLSYPRVKLPPPHIFTPA